MKIIGVTVGTTTPKPSFDQTDPKKGDYIKGDRSFITVDETLTQAGRPADAKATGDALEAITANKANAEDLTSHTSNKSNPHGVTLAQLGVAATDAELNIMSGVTATTEEINKLDGVTVTTAEINYLDGVTSSIQTQLDTKVDVVSGKGLSTNDYTDEDKEKLNAVPEATKEGEVVAFAEYSEDAIQGIWDSVVI